MNKISTCKDRIIIHVLSWTTVLFRVFKGLNSKEAQKSVTVIAYKEDKPLWLCLQCSHHIVHNCKSWGVKDHRKGLKFPWNGRTQYKPPTHFEKSSNVSGQLGLYQRLSMTEKGSWLYFSEEKKKERNSVAAPSSFGDAEFVAFILFFLERSPSSYKPWI